MRQSRPPRRPWLPISAVAFGWMLKRVVRRDSAELIARLQREIEARASQAPDVK
jgi:hypothetical protein